MKRTRRIFFLSAAETGAVAILTVVLSQQQTQRGCDAQCEAGSCGLKQEVEECPAPSVLGSNVAEKETQRPTWPPFSPCFQIKDRPCSGFAHVRHPQADVGGA